ncbi:MAG: tryptophan 7-halogenase [Proteobacteria bacterium]|nr:tryptophan 7-halogenase [Pseudomonadota bacterium]
MTAASLARHFRNSGLRITLVESSAIGTIGVGEATIPSIRRFYRDLGIADEDVMKATQATCKLAIRFDGWRRPGAGFYHPFGLFGHDVRGIGFHHFWLKMNALGLGADLPQYSLGVQLADAGRFTMPAPNPASPLSIFDWALHFDAGLFARLMKDVALANGVEAVDGLIEEVGLRGEDGFIESVKLADARILEGDLFIDCSGFRGLLIEGALETGYEDWSDWLFCDRAVALQTGHDDDGANPPPYTRSIAHAAGWQWKIPLRHRQGNGYVFSSGHVSDDDALQTLFQNVSGPARTDPAFIPFRPGRRKLAWHRNCIALGLAAGFLEPLESTSIALIETGIEKIKLLFPDKSFDRGSIDEFNEMTALEYERVRDFIILHYKLNGRAGEPFWDACRELEVPDSLARKMALFRNRGHLVKYRWEIFQAPSWIAIYHGLGYLPLRYDPAVDSYEVDYLERVFAEMEASVRDAVESVPAHGGFLAGLEQEP